MTPVFMIGTQRSGSNLLRLMLNQLNDLSSPHPPHILDRMYPLLGNYGNLDDIDNFKQLVDDVCRLVELNPVAWDGVVLDREDVLSRCRNHSLAAAFGAVYDVCAEVQNAKTWCCKSLAYIKYVDDIEEYFEKPKYIYLFRDGRDVALSFKKAVVGEKHIFNIATNWTQTQEIAINLRERIGSDRIFSVSYEQLTAEPEKTARAICDFLGMEYTDNMLEFHKTKEAENASKSSELWSNVTKPIDNNNSRKFLKEMSEDDVRIFESVAGHVLDKLGYAREYVMQGQELKLSKTDIEKFNAENRRLKDSVFAGVDKEDMDRRNRQEQLLNEIKQRSAA